MGEGIVTNTASRKTQRTSTLERSKSSRVDIDSRKFKSAVTRAHNYTEDNYHQVASATMAKAFGYSDIEKGFRDIEKEHERVGSLTPKLAERVRKLESQIEERIRRDYGEKGIRAWNRGKS